MHAEISGTIDFKDPDDPACLKRLRRIVEILPKEKYAWPHADAFTIEPQRNPDDVYDIVDVQNRKEYDMHDVIDCIIDKGSWLEVKEDYGKTILTGFARIGGHDIGIIANQRCR